MQLYTAIWAQQSEPFFSDLTITTLYMHTYLKYKALKDSKGCSCKSMEAENNIIKLNRVDSSWIAMKVLSLCGQ